MPSTASAAQMRQVDVLVDVVRWALAREAQAAGLAIAAPLPDLAGLDPLPFCSAVRGHRVSPLVAEHGDDLGLPHAAMEQVQELATQEALAAMTLAVQTPRVLDLLAAAGIPALAYKGVALSLLTTGLATDRGNGDVDLLVDERDIPAALGLLQAQGLQLEVFSPAQVEHWWPLIRWSTRELLLLGTPAQVDLHWSVTQEHGLLPPTADLLARAQVIEVLGAPVTTLGDDDTLLAACYHLHHDAYRSLRHVVDVIRLLRSRTAPVVWQGRRAAMAAESARLAVALVGGLPQGHLEALGIPPAPIAPALRQWQSHRHDPMTRDRPAGLTSTFTETRDSYRHSRFVRELPRIASTYLLMRLAPRLEAPVNAAGIVQAVTGRR